jgi:hypothetical protein
MSKIWTGVVSGCLFVARLHIWRWCVLLVLRIEKCHDCLTKFIPVLDICDCTFV